ncbi:hypothetical protein HYX11_05415 [Candidatus Woesearchaeota archaeon]|nr:hypothetical protein [Candidatus Woesearchaeota archaeon]
MNARFTGRYEQKIDYKGRTCFPHYFRRLLAPQEKIYFHHEDKPNFITILPEQLLQDKWFDMLSPLNSSYNIDDTIKQLEKIGNTSKIKIDRHGRISLGQQTIEHKVYFVGAGEYILLYLGSKKSYEEYLINLI